MIKEVFDVTHSDFPDASVYDFGALESFDEFKMIADKATLVGAVGVMPDPDPETIAFGLETVRAIRDGVIPPQPMKIVAFKVQFDTDELDRFREHLTRAKRCHDLLV